MSRDIVLVIIGGGIGIISSLLSLILSHVLSSSQQKKKFEFDKKQDNEQKKIDEDREFKRKFTNIETLRKELGVHQDVLHHEAFIINKEVFACFTAEMCIKMADGSKKYIADCKVGEYVSSFTSEGLEVRAKIKGIVKKRVGEVQIINDTLEVTCTQVIKTRLGDKHASELNISDCLISADGNEIRLNSISKRFKEVEVYSLELDGARYFDVNGVMCTDFIGKNTSRELITKLDDMV